MLLACLVANSLSAQSTIVEGLVLDYKYKEPLVAATVVFKDTTVAVTTDDNGKFRIEISDSSRNVLEVAYLGYQTRKVRITPGIYQRTTIELKTADTELIEVQVSAKKGKAKKDTAAIELYRNVVRNKKYNSAEAYDNCIYESYVKTKFGLYDVKDKFKDRVIIRKVPYIFENTEFVGNNYTPTLPIIMKETYKHVMYRKSPKKRRELLIGDKMTGTENSSISDLVEFNYEDANVYGNVINMNGKPIPCPFGDNALLNYKYFLTDTSDVNGYNCYKLEFTGKTKKDNAFAGHAWIHDSTYAIVSVLFELLPKANVNFVSLYYLQQNFQQVDGKHWFKTYESFQTNLNVFKNPDKQSFMAKKESWSRNVLINHPAIDTLVMGEPRVVIKGARNQSEEFWEAARKDAPLSRQEAKIDSTAERALKAPVIKFLKWTVESLTTRYFPAGPIDIGQFDQIYSFNKFEGSRLKFGLRTSYRLSKKVQFGGHVAYGFRDKEVKYGAYTKFHLKRKNDLWHLMGASYKYDYGFIERRVSYNVHDNILNTLVRGKNPIDNIFLSRQGKIFHEKDWLPGLTTKIELAHRKFLSVPGSFDFDIENTGLPNEGFSVAELELRLTFAKNMRYMEQIRSFGRRSVTRTQPKFEFSYKTSFKNIFGSNVSYHKLELGISQRLLSPIGYTKYELMGGKIFGQVPYPLLELHRGNESFYFENRSFNLMNDFEYASDAYASLKIEHHFDGFIMNKIPGIRVLQLRTVFYTKMLVGFLEERNENVVPFFEDMKPLNGYYAEMGFGFENIMKLFRVDAIWRLTQRQQPNVSKWGIRFVVSPKF